MKMRIEKNRAIVSVDPEELSVEPYYLQSDPAERSTHANESIGDTVRRAAWHDLIRLASEYIASRAFTYGSRETLLTGRMRSL